VSSERYLSKPFVQLSVTEASTLAEGRTRHERANATLKVLATYLRPGMSAGFEQPRPGRWLLSVHDPAGELVWFGSDREPAKLAAVALAALSTDDPKPRLGQLPRQPDTRTWRGSARWTWPEDPDEFLDFVSPASPSPEHQRLDIARFLANRPGSARSAPEALRRELRNRRLWPGSTQPTTDAELKLAQAALHPTRRR